MIGLTAGVLIPIFSQANSYQDIATKYATVALTDTQVKQAKMQGECLVGLKSLNFKKKRDFDPVAEWTNFRTTSLLQQFSPCEVLIMMELAQERLQADKP